MYEHIHCITRSYATCENDLNDALYRRRRSRPDGYTALLRNTAFPHGQTESIQAVHSL